MIFQSERIIARRFHRDDLPAFVALRNDPEVARYQSWDNYTEEAAEGFFIVNDRSVPGEHGWFQFALEDRATGVFIGDCALAGDVDGEQAEIGYTLRRDFWGRGLATEAVGGLVRYSFTTLGMHRIYANPDPRNMASCRVLEKNAFRLEGIHRESMKVRGEWTDSSLYALLRSEWQAG